MSEEQRRGFWQIYRNERRLDKTVPSRRRASQASGLGVAFILFLSFIRHANPAVYVVGGAMFVVGMLYLGVSSSALQRREQPPAPDSPKRD